MTALNNPEICTLIATLTGTPVKRAANKETAVKRFLAAASVSNIDGEAILSRASFADAAEALASAMSPAESPADPVEEIDEPVADDADGIPAFLLKDRPSALDIVSGIEPVVIEPVETKGRGRKAGKLSLKSTGPLVYELKPRKGLVEAPVLRKGETLRADNLIEGGVDAKMIDRLKEGPALHSELCAMLGGWARCDRRLARAAQIAGVKIMATRTGGDIRFEIA